MGNVIKIVLKAKYSKTRDVFFLTLKRFNNFFKDSVIIEEGVEENLICKRNYFIIYVKQPKNETSKFCFTQLSVHRRILSAKIIG